MNVHKITKTQIKHIRLLHLKKYRQKYGQFLVEGAKSVLEFLQSSIECVGIYTDEENLAGFDSVKYRNKVNLCTQKEMGQISALKNHQGVLGVFKIPDFKQVNIGQQVLLLDDIRDPGNLGTIIRSADWFGLTAIICSEKCVDCYNPKVVQASMGSLSRIAVYYFNLDQFIKSNSEYKIYVADMQGDDFRNVDWEKVMLVIGNEGKGVRSSIKQNASKTISIQQKGKAESLNAAISASIIMSAW